MIKWVARLAFVTVILGLTGTILLVRNIHQTQNREDKTSESLDSLSIDAVATAPVIKYSKKSKNAPATCPSSRQKKNTALADGVPNPQEAKTGEDNATVNETGHLSSPLSPTIKKQDRKAKVFTEEELTQLLHRVQAFKVQEEIDTNCIQLYFSNRSNDENTLNQIENYFRSQHFTMAGKESVAKKLQGIQISKVASCIRLTIGEI